jgi:hypothetical protein
MYVDDVEGERINGEDGEGGRLGGRRRGERGWIVGERRAGSFYWNIKQVAGDRTIDSRVASSG